MFNNGYLIRSLAIALGHELAGATLRQVFSVSLRELYLVFAKASGEEKALAIHFIPGKVLFRYMPVEEIQAADRAPRFREIYDTPVSAVSHVPFDRCLNIHCGIYTIQVRAFGNNADVWLAENDLLKEPFRTNTAPGAPLEPGADTPAELQLPGMPLRSEQELLRSYPFFKGDVIQHLNAQGFFDLDEKEQAGLLQKTHRYLLDPLFYVSEDHLSLFPFEGAVKYNEVIPALDDFAGYCLKVYYFNSMQSGLLGGVKEEIKKSRKALEAVNERLAGLETEVPPDEIGHILMANLHVVPAGAEKAELLDFYRDKNITIKLNKQLSAQENAAAYYRKAKNRHIERDNLQQKKQQLEEQLARLEQEAGEMQAVTDFSALRKLRKESRKKEEQPVLPYKTYEFMGYQVWVGRNAKANDEMLSRHAHKNDTWLHARNVAGSHVIIRHKAGQSIPAPVLEKAASLAAWYSKGRNESLCPVIYTERKWVRKLKGAPAGQVVVEKEQVILVKPGE